MSPDPACVGDGITFTLSGVVDSGAIKRVDCYSSTDIPPVVPDYAWELTIPPDYPQPLPPLSGSGASVSVAAIVGGTYTCTFTATANRDCPPAAHIVGPVVADTCHFSSVAAYRGETCDVTVTLKEITFGDDHTMHEEASPCDGMKCWGSGAALTGPDWTSENNPNHPLCYTRSTGMRLVVKIDVEGSGGGIGTLRVVGPDGVSGEGTFDVPCGTEERSVTIVTSPLPNVVKAYTPAGLDWSVKAPGETEFTSVGATLHRIYVTLDTPTGSAPTNRRMNFVCYAAAGLGEQDAVATAIWSVLDNEPPLFDLQEGGCPDPCPWSLMVPGNPGQCIDLAVLMEHACEIIGVPASIGYVYATTDEVNFSTDPEAWEKREYEYAPGQNRWEYLRYFTLLEPLEDSGLNNWEAVCVVNGQYCAVKETHNDSSVQLIKDIVCPNELSGNYQVWTWPEDPTDPESPVYTNTDDQYPAPLPGGCP